MLVGTTGCLGCIDLSKVEEKVPPGVGITGIKINDHAVYYAQGIKPVLQSSENILTFVFTGISFKDERHILYSYKLDGLDRDWSAPSPEYTITYSRVPPGTYTFKVSALSVDGIWSLEPASFTFTILQPFYTKWWFVGAILVLISGVVYSIYRYRIARIMEIQAIRQSISKDLHDDIGATVSSINILANMAKSDFVSENKRNQFLETIQEESKHVSESLNDIVWNVNPKTIQWK